MIDWKNNTVEPPLTKGFSIEELHSFVVNPSVSSNLLKYPCYTQAVKSNLKSNQKYATKEFKNY